MSVTCIPCDVGSNSFLDKLLGAAKGMDWEGGGKGTLVAICTTLVSTPAGF